MKTLAVLALLLAALTGAEAQQQQQQQHEQAAAAARPAAPEPALKVFTVQRVRLKGDDQGATDRAGLGDIIELNVENLEKWYAVKDNQTKKFVLVIDSRVFKDITSGPQARSDTLQFMLAYADSKDVWTAVLGRPTWSWRKVSVSAAHADGRVIQAEPSNFVFIVLPWTWFVVCAVIFLVFALVFLRVAHSSNIVRDAGPEPEATATVPNSRKPVSLGRTQMAVWFFFVFAAFILIWVMTGNPNTVKPSLLALMGISAATALSSVTVESTRRQEARTQLEALGVQQAQLEARRTTLATEIEDLDRRLAQPNLAAADAGPLIKLRTDKQVERATVTAQSDQAKATETRLKAALASQPSAGVITDLLSDESGVSLHRFQIVAWTAILIVVFVRSVWETLAMPEFDATVVTLMGISSGTYVGFKFAEKK